MTPRDYARFSIALPSNATAKRIWQRLGGVEGYISVNALDANGQPAMLSEALVEECRATGATALRVEALPDEQYKQIASTTLDQAVEAIAALRAAWRTRPIGDTATELQALLRRLNDLALLASLFAHQRAKPSLLAAAMRLPPLSAQLAASSFQLDDTVRAADDAHYEILPVLRQLQPALRPSGR
jgi:hypothetical protein